MSVFPLPSTVSLVEMLLQIPQILPKRPTLALPVGFFRMPRSWLTTSFVMFYLIHSAACDVRNVIHAAWSLQQPMTYTRDSKFTVVSYGLISTLAFLRTICQAKRKWKLGFKIEDFWSVVATDMMLCLFHLRVIECSSIYTWISWECSIVGAALVHMITSLSHRYMVVRTPNHKFNVSCVYAVSRLLHDAMDSSVAASKLSQLHEMHDKSSGSTAFSPLNALSEKLIAESSFLLHLPNRHKPPFRFIMNEYSQSLKLIASTLSFLNDDDSRHVRFCSCTFNLMDTIHIVVATYKRLGILHGFSFELRDELIDPLLSYIGDYQMLQLFLSAISLEVISHSMSEGTGKITFWVAYTESDQIEFGWDIIDAKESRQEWNPPPKIKKLASHFGATLSCYSFSSRTTLQTSFVASICLMRPVIDESDFGAFLQTLPEIKIILYSDRNSSGAASVARMLTWLDAVVLYRELIAESESKTLDSTDIENELSYTIIKNDLTTLSRVLDSVAYQSFHQPIIYITSDPLNNIYSFFADHHPYSNNRVHVLPTDTLSTLSLINSMYYTRNIGHM